MICVIVAHPDDESFWFGGSLLMFRDAKIETVIVCLTNASHPVRASEFQGACLKLGFQGLMLDYPDGGLQHVPYFGNKVTELLRQNSIKISDLTCVITHAPHGNERSHPQHVQCFSHVRTWCLEKKLPLGFFSEKLLSEVKATRKSYKINNCVTLYSVNVNLRPLAKALTHLLATAPLNVKGYLRLVRSGYRLFQRFRAIQSLLALHIHMASKQSLLETYASQVEGLKHYDNYYHQYEYLYLTNRQTASRLTSYLRCLSY